MAEKAKRYKSSGRPKKASKAYKRPVYSAVWSTPSAATVAGTRLRSSLIYSEKDISVNPGLAGSTGVRVFSLSSLYDPDFTGAGHQPAGFDQIMAIYEQFQVISVKYRIVITNQDGTEGAIHGVSVCDVSTTNPDARVYIENGQTQWNVTTGNTQCGPSVSTFCGVVDLPKSHGLSYSQYMGDDVYKGSASASPTENMFLHVWAASSAGADSGTQLLLIELQYDCLFTGGKLNALS